VYLSGQLGKLYQLGFREPARRSRTQTLDAISAYTSGKTIGLVGFAQIAAEVPRIARMSLMIVLASDRKPKQRGPSTPSLPQALQAHESAGAQPRMARFRGRCLLPHRGTVDE
jgi:hypothetical protein